MPTVLKIGGHQLEDDAYLREMAAVIPALPEDTLIVHGGGDEVSALQRQLGIEPRYHEGLRVTDGASLRLMTMALSGLVNKRLVGCLLAAGVDALGISGLDRGIVRARPHPALPNSHTGVVAAVDEARLRQLLALGITPVIAPLCLSEDGRGQFNVNADHVAAAIAAELAADRLFFLTDVAGVQDERGLILPELDEAASAALLQRGVIQSGMVPKVRSALAALQRGAREVTIGNLQALRERAGTTFLARTEPVETGIHD